MNVGWLYTIRLKTKYEDKNVYKFGKTNKINPWHRIKQYVRWEKPDKTINLSFVEDTNIEAKILIELKKDSHLKFISDFGFEWFNCEEDEYLYKIIEQLINKYSKIKLTKNYYIKYINTNNELMSEYKEMWFSNNIIKKKWLRDIGCPYPKKNLSKIEIEIYNKDEWTWSKIEDISYIKYQDIKIRYKSCNIDNEDYKQFIKFKMKKHYTRKKCLEKGIEYFNEFYYLTNKIKKVMEVIDFKRMLFEIKYDFSNFNEWKIYNKNQNNVSTDVYNMKVNRYEHLIKFFNKLGFINEDSINIDTVFYGKDFEKLSDDYINVDVKSLNTMLSDGYIRISKKDDFITLNTKQIKGIFNQILKDTFDLEVSSKGLKYIKGEDGKRKKLTIMGVSNVTKSINKKKDSLEEIYAKTKWNEKWSNNKYNPFNLL